MWPIWGFLTPVLMIVLFMGATMAMTFLPSGTFGTLIFWACIVAMGTVSHLIPHQDVDSGHVH